jgi:hypothetical protein
VHLLASTLALTVDLCFLPLCSAFSWPPCFSALVGCIRWNSCQDVIIATESIHRCEIDEGNVDCMLVEVCINGRIIVRDLSIRCHITVETLLDIVMCDARMLGGNWRSA